MHSLKEKLDDYKTAIQNKDAFVPDIIPCSNPLGVTNLSDSTGEGAELAENAVSAVPLKK